MAGTRDPRIEAGQLSLIGEMADLLDGAAIGFWLSGGWAVDFHLGSITRGHSDVDLIVDVGDGTQLVRLLESVGFDQIGEAPGIVWFERDSLRLEITFIERAGEEVVTPGYELWPWPTGSFTESTVTFSGVTVKALSIEGILDSKRGHAEHLGRPPRSYDVDDIVLLERQARRVDRPAHPQRDGP